MSVRIGVEHPPKGLAVRGEEQPVLLAAGRALGPDDVSEPGHGDLDPVDKEQAPLPSVRLAGRSEPPVPVPADGDLEW